MDLEKAYEAVNRKALWCVLVIYVIGKTFWQAQIVFYLNKDCASVRLAGKVSSCIEVSKDLRQGCQMSKCWFNSYVDGAVRKL